MTIQRLWDKHYKSLEEERKCAATPEYNWTKKVGKNLTACLIWAITVITAFVLLLVIFVVVLFETVIGAVYHTAILVRTILSKGLLLLLGKTNRIIEKYGNQND